MSKDRNAVSLSRLVRGQVGHAAVDLEGPRPRARSDSGKPPEQTEHCLSGRGAPSCQPYSLHTGHPKTVGLWLYNDTWEQSSQDIQSPSRFVVPPGGRQHATDRTGDRQIRVHQVLGHRSLIIQVLV